MDGCSLAIFICLFAGAVLHQIKHVPKVNDRILANADIITWCQQLVIANSPPSNVLPARGKDAGQLAFGGPVQSKPCEELIINLMAHAHHFSVNLRDRLQGFTPGRNYEEEV